MEHSALVGLDTRDHRIIHELLNTAHVALTEEGGLDPAKPEDAELLDYAFKNVAHFLRHSYADAVEALPEPEQSLMAHPQTAELFLLRTAFEMGMRLGSAGRALFAASDKPIESFTDEAWREEITEEAKFSAKLDNEVAEWEEKLRVFMDMNEEEFKEFKEHDRPVMMPFSSAERVKEFYELMSKKPGGHDHGPFSSTPPVAKTDTTPGEGTGQYL